MAPWKGDAGLPHQSGDKTLHPFQGQRGEELLPVYMLNE